MKIAIYPSDFNVALVDHYVTGGIGRFRMFTALGYLMSFSCPQSGKGYSGGLKHAKNWTFDRKRLFFKIILWRECRLDLENGWNIKNRTFSVYHIIFLTKYSSKVQTFFAVIAQSTFCTCFLLKTPSIYYALIDIMY